MLNNIDYNSYIMRTLAFARTIVIKSEDIALADNRAMQQYLGIDSGTDKTTWRYYMNLNGEYHFTDEMMVVQSLDNGEQINFTKENLDIHLATKRAYRQGSYYYSRLTERYLGQSELIKGIINPIPQSESIPANDYQILRYTQDYIQWNEYQLIPELQKHVNDMVTAYFNTEYKFTDNLMLTGLLAVLHGSLVSAILQIREDADGSRYANDFYIWSRLNSLGISSIYKQVLDNKQVMWLYRNLDYVLRLQGRRKTFDELTDIILTHRAIPLARHTTVQNTEDQVLDITPTPKFQSQPVNKIRGLGTNIQMVEVDDLIRKEIPLALDNDQNSELAWGEAYEKIKYGLHTDIPTKVLESTMVDATDLNPYNIMRVLHEQWVYMAKMKLYDINHDFTDMRTGKHFRLRTGEAYVLWSYLVNRYNGNETREIGFFPYHRARKANLPNYLQLMELGIEPILSETLCKDIVNSNPPITRIISPDAFYGTCRTIFDADWDQRKLVSVVQNELWMAQVDNAVSACYETGLAQFTTEETYQDWLVKHDLTFGDYSDEEILDTAWGIWRKVTGWENAEYITLGDQQRGLINLMKDLTSYTVQYIGSTDSSLGHHRLNYHPSMESDFYQRNDPDPGTALENDMEQILPGVRRIVPDISLETEHKSFSVDGGFRGWVEMYSIQSGCLPGGSELTPIEDPEPSYNSVMLCMGMTMKPDPANNITP